MFGMRTWDTPVRAVGPALRGLVANSATNRCRRGVMRAARSAMLSDVAVRRDAPPVDRLLANLAASQHGVVARGQLRAAGLTDSAIARRVEAGRLHRVRRAVYAVGHPALTTRGRWVGAVLACG